MAPQTLRTPALLALLFVAVAVAAPLEGSTANSTAPGAPGELLNGTNATSATEPRVAAQSGPLQDAADTVLLATLTRSERVGADAA